MRYQQKPSGQGPSEPKQDILVDQDVLREASVAPCLDRAYACEDRDLASEESSVLS